MLNRIRRFGFRLLYNDMAFIYDRVSRLVSLGNWRSWQRAVFPFLPPPEAGLVLELAHGTGDLQLDLLNAGYRTAALDLSSSMGRLAQQKLARAGLSTLLLRGEARHLPIPSDSVASLVCTFPTTFIFEHQTLKEILRVLKRDASAVIVLSGTLAGAGLQTQFIRCLYLLSGQAYSPLSDSKLLALFQVVGMSARAHTTLLDGSLVQTVMLTKSGGAALEDHNHNLDMARVS
ncbi:MAG: class I SAM-dependent methyltransferase [Chloroflexota bacterium]|nr:class I SAM-dependent methyltransferase [Chloroflexota bacterium]MDE2909449.1 class I SAM-dependent methyltransferase [Chloroflexota bacterium]